MTRDQYHELSIKFEDMAAKIDAILEIVVPMHKDVMQIKNSDIPEIKADISAIKADQKITNAQVRDHEHRITKLETQPV